MRLKKSVWRSVSVLVLLATSPTGRTTEASLLEKFAHKCREAPSWNVVVVSGRSAPGQSAEGGRRIYFSKPGRLRAEPEGDDKPLIVVNESQGWVYAPRDKEYFAVTEADAVRLLQSVGLALPLVADPDQMEGFDERLKSTPTPEPFAGASCLRHDLSFEHGTLTLWLEDLPDGPRLHGAEWDPAAPSDGVTRPKQTEIYRDWKSEKAEAALFTFTPPEGAHVIDALSRRQSAKVNPIKAPTADGHLTRDLIKRQQVWMEHQLVDRFVKRHQNEPWLTAATALLRATVPFLCTNATKDQVTGTTKRPPLDLKQTGHDLIAQGCDDPVFCFAVGSLESFQRRTTREDADIVFKKLPALTTGEDTAFIKALIVSWLWQSSYAGEPAARRRDVWDACQQLLPDLIIATLEEATAPEDSLCLAQTIYGSATQIFLNAPDNSMKARLAQCKGAPWLVDTLIAEIEVKEGWKARGSGWASTVTEEGWRGFEQHLSSARQNLVSAWKARPDAPWAASLMIPVTMAGHGLPGLNEREWFDRATTAIFDHSPAYTNLLLALLPRWGGSHEQMLDFAKACADTQRYDTIVPSRLFVAVKNVAADLACMDEVHRDPELCRRIVALQQAMLNSAQTATHSHYFRSFLVANAFLARDYETAAAALSQLQSPVHDEAVARLAYFGKPPLVWKGMLALHAAPDAFKHFLEAEALYNAGDLPKARQSYQRARSAGGGSAEKPALQLINMRLAAIAVEERLATKGWVTLQPNEQRQLWMPQTGNWWNFPDGSISFKSASDDTEGRVLLNARIGLEFEVRGKLDAPAELDHPQLGIVFGYQWDHNGFATAVAGVTRRNPVAYGAALVPMAYDWTDKRPFGRAKIRSDSSFRFRVEKGIATLWIDEKMVLSAVAMDLFKHRSPWREMDPNANLFGFGANFFPKGETRLKDIAFRRLGD
ncbi:MAG: hypothetical protein H7A55_09085 [Verrucomicrobiaceae bacterium]|nr:hypothetical protein [Verrucomicrobiaceae bacterium]